jgi:hypothetical protein
MSMFTWELALACGLLVPGQSALAQTATEPVYYPPAQAASNVGDFFAYYDVDWAEAAAVVLAQAGAASPRPAVDEEIEVMRALLVRKLGGAVERLTSGQTANRLWTAYLNGQQTNTADPSVNKNWASNLITQQPYGTTHNQYRNYLNTQTGRLVGSGVISVEGSYLDGYGAVLTVMLAAHARHDPSPQAPTPAPAQLSDWERTRRQLQGETVPTQPTAAPKEQPLGEVLLHLLADNGKHFAHLRDDERLTVAVVFRGSAAGRVSSSTSNNTATGSGTVNTLTGTASSTTTTGGTFGSTTSSSIAQTARDLELLGDLHLKQGQHAQAIDTYAKAADAAREEWTRQFGRLLEANRQPTVADQQQRPEALKGMRRFMELQTKLAQAQTAAGKLDEARQTLEKLQQVQNAMTQAEAATPNPATKPAGPNLPAKLTVSATKKQLDLVGAGKMTFEDFRKEAKVTFYSATGADKPATSGEKK